MATERRARRLIYGAVALLFINLFIMMIGYHQSTNAQVVGGRAKFMYKVVKAGTDEQSLQAVVDIFSRDGWELVTHSNDILIFKK